jgi:alpha-tubulin suppressor-like RCC1 family protein
VVALSASAEEACALARDGDVYCWGSNLYRGIGDKASGVPLHVTAPLRVKVLP